MKNGLDVSSSLKHLPDADDVAAVDYLYEAEQAASRLTIHTRCIIMEGSVTVT